MYITNYKLHIFGDFAYQLTDFIFAFQNHIAQYKNECILIFFLRTLNSKLKQYDKSRKRSHKR